MILPPSTAHWTHEPRGPDLRPARAGRRDPRAAVHGRDDRLRRGRARPGRHHPRAPPGRAADEQGGALRPRVQRLLLQQGVRRLVGRPRVRLLRDRPAPLRTQHARVADPQLRHRHPRVLRRRRRRVGPDHRPRRPRPRRRHRALHRRTHAVAVGRRGRTAPQGRGPQLPVARPAWLGPDADRGHGDGPRPRRPPADARDPARDPDGLRREPAPRLRRRVGLRPQAQDVGVLAHVRRVVAGDPQRPRRGAQRPRHRVPRAGDELRGDHRRPGAERRGPPQRHRARRGADPALVDRPGAARHVHRRRRGDARHLPVAAHGPCARVRGARPLARCLRRGRGHGHKQGDQRGQTHHHDHAAQHVRREAGDPRSPPADRRSPSRRRSGRRRPSRRRRPR